MTRSERRRRGPRRRAARAADTYWRGGYILDRVICHSFMRKYGSWTIDFDSMTYIVGR
ncbi:MAG: hypothetical protein ACRCVA_19600 [Phreatobacter sp.]